MIHKICEFAASNPKLIAVTDYTGTYTYADLLSAVYSISTRINNIPVDSDIAICMKKGFWFYASELACLYSGVPFCPIDIDAPEKRNLNILNTLSPDLILTKHIEDFKKQFKLAEEFKLLSVSDTSLKNNKDECLSRNGEMAYTIFTSGSTGAPKGVKIRVLALEKFLEWSISTFGAQPGDKWGQFSNIAFDLSIVDIFTCFLSGAELVTIDGQMGKLFPGRIVEEKRITIWHGVPSSIQLLTEFGTCDKKQLSSLKIASFCGETLFSSQVEHLWNYNSHLRIFNTYGPTEGTLFCTHYEVLKEDINSSNPSISIGDSIPGWYLHINNESDSQKGETIIYGNYIGQYLDHKLDVSKYFQFSFAGNNYRGYLTGDIIKIENGKKYFVGRKDSQIKINGNRFDLKEIEYAALKSGALEVIALFNEGKIGLALVLVNDQNFDEFKKQISRLLPKFAIPTSFEILLSIPRNVNGKLNRKKVKQTLWKEKI